MQKSSTKYLQTESNNTLERSYTMMKQVYDEAVDEEWFNKCKSTNVIKTHKQNQGQKLHDHLNRCQKSH
jgi:hypothetical protein